MDTMATDTKRSRRTYSAALKAQILAECMQPHASVAKVAMAHGINANVVHGWRQLARQGHGFDAATPSFVAVNLDPPASAPVAQPTPRLADCAHINVELRRGPLAVHIAWPMSCTEHLGAWLRELLR